MPSKLYKFLFMALLCQACSQVATSPAEPAGFVQPDSLIAVIQKAVQTGNCERLHLLCDSLHSPLPDARRICEAADNPGDFQLAFAGMQSGALVIQGDSAQVPVQVQGQAHQFYLIRLQGRWFLQDYR